MNDPKNANRFIIGGVALIVLGFLLIENWYADAGILGNIVHYNIIGTEIPVRWVMVAAVGSIAWGFYLRTKNSN